MEQTAKIEQVTREEHYLAQIACEVRRSFVKKPQSVKLEDFLLKFTAVKPSEAPKPPTHVDTPPDGLERRVAASKAFWRGLVNKGTKQ